MLFCTEKFAIFFAIVFAIYWALPSARARMCLYPAASIYFCTFWNQWLALFVCVTAGLDFLFVRRLELPWARGRVWLLLAASIYFYACWNQWLAALVCVTASLDYLIARRLEALAVPRQRGLLLGFSIAMNLGLLCYFKYANFFLRSLEEALLSVGANASLPVLSVILPIGISFYTFEAISYTVDVYRRRIPAERDPARFLLFILFFPHLVAGPIVRARDFLPQVARTKRWSWPRLHLGARLFILGLFKKLAIADRMALYADPVFRSSSDFNTGALWLAAFAYALQVYADFSGYTDMALGAAHALGYKLAPNFDRPYSAANISEFWRRWHISLSTWLRDYLFIPLGGSRGGTWRTWRNLIVTMTLGGLWHGANWPFVVFGFIQGCWLSLHDAFRKWCERQPLLNQLLRTPVGTAGRIAGTFTAFTCTLVVFRSPTIHAGASMLGGMFSAHGGKGEPLHAQGLLVTAVIVAMGQAFDGGRWWPELVMRVPAPIRGFGLASVVALALALAPEADKAFIYFQF